MAVVDRLVRLGDWLRRRPTRVYMFLITYLAALASLLSFAYINSGNGPPSAVEFALIFVAVMAGFLLSLDSTGH